MQSQDINILMVTHNARMRCLLEDIISDKMKMYRQKYNTNEIRFKNCCILKLDFFKDSSYGLISLFHGGMIDNRKDGMYFSSIFDKDNDKDIIFDPTIFNINKLSIDMIDTNNYHIYMIRHGEATHNLKSSYHLKKDTLLTIDKGIIQAEQSAISLAKFLSYVDYCFCSELKRTRQTLAIFMKTLNINKHMIVLPCSNELHYSKNGKCDSQTHGLLSIIPAENKESCSTNRKADMCSSIENYVIDWSVYDKFKKDRKCSDHNMIQIMFEII
jgi:broad specificity phosphatase PhoE